MGAFTGKVLRDVTLADLQRLVDNGVGESLHLEYKRQLNLGDPDKVEFLRDVTAFANAEGGTIIFGVDEDRLTGLPKSVTGFGIPNRDDLRRWLENLLRDGIDERLPPCEIEFVPVDAANAVLLMRVPPSVRAPHMVSSGAEKKFFIRVNGGKQQMSTAQIRDSVLRTDSVADRVQRFIRERRDKWASSLVKGPFWMMHVIPLLRTTTLDLADERITRRLTEMQWPMASSHVGHCIEGFKVLDRGRPESAYVTQRITFRDGTVELLDQYAFNTEQKLLEGITFKRIVRETASSILKLYAEVPVHPPLAISLSLHRIAGFTIPTPHRSRGPAPIVEDEVIVEPLVVTESPLDAWAAVRPAADVIWNAFGYATHDAFGT